MCYNACRSAVFKSKMEIQTLSKRFGVNVEVGTEGNYPNFLASVKGKKVLVLADLTTKPISEIIVRALGTNGTKVLRLTYPEAEPVAGQTQIDMAKEAGGQADYLLAVGTGTLNDIAKYTGRLLNKPCGVFATAPSMDGFTSGVAALVLNNSKVTLPAQVVSDVLIDYTVLTKSPKLMMGAGVADIMAKYCALADWKIATLLGVNSQEERYNDEAASFMLDAVRACDESVPALIRGDREGVESLMNALLISGYAMVIAGHSRVASGAEHHMSHFLEMDFLARGERIPLHGIKVGLGTLVSLYLYQTLKNRPKFNHCEKVYLEAEKLPSYEYVEELLASLHCPTRFSQIGISRKTMRNMLFEAYKIREYRYTILQLYCKNGFMDEAADELIEKFY